MLYFDDASPTLRPVTDSRSPTSPTPTLPQTSSVPSATSSTDSVAASSASATSSAGEHRSSVLKEPDQLLQLLKQLISSKCLRLHLMSQKELLTTVRRSEHFAAISGELSNCILDAMELKDSETCPRRYQPPDYSAGLIRSDEEFLNGIEDVLFLKPEFSDLTLVAGRERFPAHRVILAFRSEYFRAMLYGGLMESVQTEIELKEVNPTALRAVLKYIYSVEIDLSELNVEEILATLRLAHEYGLTKFQEAIVDYLKVILKFSQKARYSP
ncbi:unnamed protein product [Heligmosomoides polygyrus]|uniref:BTB domain-containing protein n=1 Tax=Heligmosomoides polygyrus TaxID=6339 RepID=A0A183GP97_HELPZ|nr:unnamed protein product [Heligmosomoides polygyrus]